MGGGEGKFWDYWILVKSFNTSTIIGATTGTEIQHSLVSPDPMNMSNVGNLIAFNVLMLAEFYKSAPELHLLSANCYNNLRTYMDFFSHQPLLLE